MAWSKRGFLMNVTIFCILECRLGVFSYRGEKGLGMVGMKVISSGNPHYGCSCFCTEFVICAHQEGLLYWHASPLPSFILSESIHTNISHFTFPFMRGCFPNLPARTALWKKIKASKRKKEKRGRINCYSFMIYLIPPPTVRAENIH